MSDAQSPNDAEAEPVDAEFEPAPGAARKSARLKPGRPTPWLTIVLVTVLAGVIGGGSGWLIGRYGPDPARAALDGRITALEAGGVEAGETGLIDAFQARLTAVEAEIAGAQLRAEGVEQLVRDVASLRAEVEALTAAPAVGEASTGTADPALEARLDAALAALADRLTLAEAAVETSRAQAEQAQSAVQQALSLMAQSGAAALPEDGMAAAPGSDPAIVAALAQTDARVSALETAQAQAREQAARLGDVETTLAALEAALAAPQDDAELPARMAALEHAVAALQADIAREAPQEAERAVAFAALSRAAASDEPFPVALADLRRIWPGAPGADALAPIARTGAPTIDQLVAGFPAAAVRAATGEAQLLFGVIRLEREDEIGPTDAIEAALAEEDLAAAVNAARALEAAARDASAAWLLGAEARLAVDRALAQMSDALADGAGAGR